MLMDVATKTRLDANGGGLIDFQQSFQQRFQQLQLQRDSSDELIKARLGRCLCLKHPACGLAYRRTRVRSRGADLH